MITADGKCSTCGDPIPTNMMGCKRCIAARDAAEQRNFQKPYVLRVIAGEIELRLHRDDRNVKHIEKWGFEVTFCEKILSPRQIKSRRCYLWWEPEKFSTAGLCPGCTAAFNTIVAEGMRPPAA